MGILESRTKHKMKKKPDNQSLLKRELAKAKKRIAELERGEFICTKCGLRKNSAKVEANF